MRHRKPLTINEKKRYNCSMCGRSYRGKDRKFAPSLPPVCLKFEHNIPRFVVAFPRILTLVLLFLPLNIRLSRSFPSSYKVDNSLSAWKFFRYHYSNGCILTNSPWMYAASFVPFSLYFAGSADQKSFICL